MDQSFLQYFSSENFMPHGHCYLWEPILLWLHVVSDALIAIAYFSIPVTLIVFVRKRKDLEFDWMFICFAAFITACGVSHLMEIWTVWVPDYWLAGLIKGITALVSIPTAYLLVKLVPFALDLPSPSEMVAKNDQLSQEIKDRLASEHALSMNNVELAVLNEELKAFSYSVSHDLRTPLRSMDGFSLALLEDYDDVLAPEAKDLLRRIRLASQRMGRLIDDMLRLSQVTRTEIRMEQVDLSALCTTILETMQEAQPERFVKSVIDPDMVLMADKPLINIAFENLIQNAWKFTGKTASPMIHVGSKQVDGHTVYFVTDNGAGFDMAHATKLFGTFERLHSTADFQGTGIGLALVKRIINRHAGKLWAEAAVGQGASFYFYVEGNEHAAST